MNTINPAEFKRITLNNRKIFKQAFTVQDSRSCESSFTNMFCWGAELDLKFAEYKGRLLVYSPVEKYLLFPNGEYFPPEELIAIMREMHAEGMIDNCYDVPEAYIEKYPEIKEIINVSANEDYFDYIHLTSDLVELSGKKLRKKRNLIRQFEEAYPECEIVEISCANAWACCEFGVMSNIRRREDTIMHKETIAIQCAFQFFPQLEMEGLAVFHSGKVIAFSVFSRLNSDTFDVHFEKADHHYKGAAQYINFKTAEHLQDQCKYINREQDLGLKGLRRAKRSYDPVFMYKRHELKFSD